MKIKTLVKLNKIKKKPAKMFIYCTYTKEMFELTYENYLFCADNKIVDWSYISSDKGDEIIIYF